MVVVVMRADGGGGGCARDGRAGSAGFERRAMVRWALVLVRALSEPRCPVLGLQAWGPISGLSAWAFSLGLGLAAFPRISAIFSNPFLDNTFRTLGRVSCLR